ncbi:hypothetical protein F1717_10280 [Micrococcus luteus]|uniref:Type I restriction-modification system subunit M N-terminal domain-containing protein n=1 Tax=Micrococcus yunnanensis TaxID=566027 RepID=A0AAP5T8D2_9MICC|nr:MULTISPECIES: type I restriction-modification system subunit M N-terminal domain-containing protein [Micrococcus]MCG7421743.1 type I restriction-modification system subunit M N-terminal domain-containing protein [Micrococcus sp. ACRRV]MDV7176944.1 type I restriction-modification system subunit M N-terminal domain-containing protein [Micrococcus yunnanensis]QGY84104.1 hypothetical protein F1717_10280 [Micrococcus luteus]RNM14457.1 hypothetical protein EFY10_03895 [Micrococcus sp. RIT608]WRQ4
MERCSQLHPARRNPPCQLRTFTTPASLTDFVWGIADQLRGVYKPNQYGMVVLPPTILRRVEELMPPLGGHAGAG